MARQPRIDFAGAMHHVMNGGVNGTAIYRNAMDRRRFLNEMTTAFSEHGLRIHAYALMTTHFHILAESTTGELSAGMKALGSRYSQGFNAVHERYGPLFRSRFTSRLIDTREYFAAASRYIHLNPLGTGVPDLADYIWSSWPAYAGAVDPPNWLDMRTTIAHFDSTEEYIRFITAGIRSAA